MSTSSSHCLFKPFGFSAAFRVVLFALVTVSISSPTVGEESRPNPATHPDVLAAERLFSAWLESQMAYRGLPGIVVGVVSDQELIWSVGFGWADIQAKRPMTPSTKFRMASHSKVFTATAIMQLREQGKLGLDDPVAKHLPWLNFKPAEPGDALITIEELLTHSSGLQREAGSHWSDYEFPTEEELRRLMSDRQAAFSPGVRWKYSNLAFTLAGLVVEKVSGTPWADYVQAHIYDPLEMRDSSVDKMVDGLAVGYGRRMPDGTREILPFVDARVMGAATGITSTLEDMAKFVSAQFRKGPSGGRQIVSTASLRELHRIRMLENNWTRGSAIGFAVRRVKDKTYIGHSGGYPGFTTQTLFHLESKVGVIVLTNTEDSNPGDIAIELLNTVGEAVAKATATKPAIVAWDSSWARFAGLYRSRGRDSQVVLLNEQLVLIDPNAPNLENPVTLEPLGGGQFRFVANTGGGPVGEIVRFVEQDGRVVRMITGDSYLERVRE